uniref:NADH dehydrogenase subunit 9 n=1 Tax=Cyanophora sudae TaxID=1522369 RepID=A0A873WYR0_9EUKA|nr:NADH dehydrogenase subunit 9 [Cyanophora sudae]QPB15058.1 NADH dehydrogenase subunit 9 [Cyanophora sudae]
MYIYIFFFMNNNKIFKDFANLLINLIPKFIKDVLIIHNELILIINNNDLKNVVFFLKNHSYTQYKILCDITAVDYIDREERFEVVYQLLSIVYGARIRLKVLLTENQAIESISMIHPSANWYEREVWDLFGIFFMNHPDLRRILTDYGFEGHPLKKDFPLTGYLEVRYDASIKQVISEPVDITQEFRNFNFSSPWEIKTKN